MKILQQLPARCPCPECDAGCQCGDCSTCSNAALDRAVTGYAKRVAVALCVFLAFGGFVFFVPVMAMGASPPVTRAVSLRVQLADNATEPLGSIGFCYLGVGALYIHGVYYPSVALNQTATRICTQSP